MSTLASINYAYITTYTHLVNKIPPPNMDENNIGIVNQRLNILN